MHDLEDNSKPPSHRVVSSHWEEYMIRQFLHFHDWLYLDFYFLD